ncbi:PHD finger protein ING1 isoform X2 [Magnolia sinica]|uniref:PHD finger protein ING1 isoform X2 n=1 Tax=Magnolia sinica TaxID=86752 RepID=UPI002659584F|nr:PHD finger protein ING1 isoform X2 [Magnolia sinica]
MSISDLESLPSMLQRYYSVMHDLDKSLQAVQRQNEQRCEQEIEDIRRGIQSGNITPNTSLIRFSDEALDEQKHCIRIADEKVTLAVRAYDMVDAHIQQLDDYMRRFDDELRREKDLTGASGTAALNLDGNTKSGRASESSKGGRKKTRLAVATAAAAAADPSSMDLDLPVDPNEPTYCFCNQVSFGEMVACDNPDCKIEWFHFGCVGLKEQPRGKWYCSNCTGMQKRRKAK